MGFVQVKNRKGKKTHELIFLWLSWLAVLLVGGYARELPKMAATLQIIGGQRHAALDLPCIHYLHKSHNTIHLGGLFALKQWISCSLKHDTVPRVNSLYFFFFYVNNPAKQIALWYCASCEFL